MNIKEEIQNNERASVIVGGDNRLVAKAPAPRRRRKRKRIQETSCSNSQPRSVSFRLRFDFYYDRIKVNYKQTMANAPDPYDERSIYIFIVICFVPLCSANMSGDHKAA